MEFNENRQARLFNMQDVRSVLSLIYRSAIKMYKYAFMPGNRSTSNATVKEEAQNRIGKE